MAATKAQRIGIWIIAVLMLVGSVGAILGVVLSSINAQAEQARYNELLAEYRAEQTDYQKKLSDKYYALFSNYTSRVQPFDAAAVTELKTEDLVEGTGAEITTESSFYAYYHGWNPSGKVFAGGSSVNETNDGFSTPFFVSPGGVIEGWTKGLEGMKQGGIRELTIPASLAYGETDKGEDIPPNTPLKFIVIVLTDEEVNGSPKATDELIKLDQRYGATNG